MRFPVTDGFIVSSLANPEPLFFYRPDIGSIVNIVPLQYAAVHLRSSYFFAAFLPSNDVSFQTHVKSTDDPKKIAFLASFRNL